MKFHFQVRTDTHVYLSEAAEVAGLEEARIEAAKRVGQLLTEHAKQIWVDEDWQMDVTDDTALILFTLNISASNSLAAMGGKRPDGLND